MLYYEYLKIKTQLSFAVKSRMRSNRLQIALASVAILAAAGFGVLLRPHELMARNSIAPRLETVIPRQFADWSVVPEISPVKPVDPEAYVQPDSLSEQDSIRKKWDGHTRMAAAIS